MHRSFRSFQKLHSSPSRVIPVCSSNKPLNRRCLTAFDQKDKEGVISDDKKQIVTERPQKRPTQFPSVPAFNDRVKEIIPLAVERYRQRRKRDEWEVVEPRSPKNIVVTLPTGEKRVVKGDKQIPLYREWEKDFGKPIGDSRPYYRKQMGPLLMPYKENPNLQTLTSLIIVEGLADWTTLQKAVNAPIFVCDGGCILDHVYHKYVKRTIEPFQGDVIVLMDPDTAGRRMRTSINTLIAPCKHAFISEYECVVGMGTTHESIGIEHASPEAIREALLHLKNFDSDPPQTFAFDTLYDLRLLQTVAENTEGVRLRRRFACGFLGIGFCDGKQLIKQLNRYGFSMEEVQSAVSKADKLVEAWKQNPWRLQKDYSHKAPRRWDKLTIPNHYLTAF